MKNISTLTLALFMAATTPAFSAVGNDKSTAYIEDAETYLKKGDVSAAIIQLKNAIVADPDNASYRVMLGDLYLRTMNPVSAEKEYNRAVKLGLDESEVIVNLSKARLMRREYQTILDTLTVDKVSEEEKANVYLIIGKAHQGLNNLDEALSFYTKGEELGGASDSLSIAIGQIYYLQKDMEKAEKKVDEALVLNPKNIDGIILKGDLVNLHSGPSKSLDYFEQALAYEPRNLLALFKSAAILFDLQRSDEALERLDVVFSMAPKHPLANYLAAVIYARKNELDKAEEYLNASGNAMDNFPGALVLRGVMNYSKQNYAQAIYHLDKLIKIAPDNIVARRLLGASLLRQGEAEQAVKTLLPLVKNDKADSVIYALLGSASMKLGKFDEGTAYFEKSVEMKPDQSSLQTQLALSRLASGDSQAAQESLAEVLEKDPNSTQAAVFLTLIALREMNYTKALEGADTLIKQSAENPVGYNLKGAAYVGLKDVEKARAQFRKALEVSPIYHSASMNLARLEFQEGNDAGGVKIYRDILETDNKHAGALLAMAQYSKKIDDLEAAENYYLQAISASPDNLRTRIELSEFFIKQKKLERAKAISQQIITDFPDQAAGYEATGNINLMMKDPSGAVANFERMAAILSTNPGAYQLLARAQLQNNQMNEARKSFLKALSLATDKAGLLVDLTALESSDGNLEKAKGYIEQLKALDPKKPLAYVIEGRFYGTQGDTANSLASFEKAEALGADGSRFIVDIASAYIRNGQKEKGTERLKKWLTTHRNDLIVRHVLASHYLQEGDFQESIAHYEVILGQDAKNAVALNNIAWLYSQVGQNAKALGAAESAYESFPEEATFIDTYAWILVQQGQNKKGLDLLQKAVTKAPKMAEVRYHYAFALNKAGRSSAARRELETVVASGENFSGVEDARKLLAELSK